MMASGVPADVLMEAISTVSEIIRGNQSNQEYFASVVVPSTPPRFFIGRARFDWLVNSTDWQMVFAQIESSANI